MKLSPFLFVFLKRIFFNLGLAVLSFSLFLLFSGIPFIVASSLFFVIFMTDSFFLFSVNRERKIAKNFMKKLFFKKRTYIFLKEERNKIGIYYPTLFGLIKVRIVNEIGYYRLYDDVQNAQEGLSELQALWKEELAKNFVVAKVKI